MEPNWAQKLSKKQTKTHPKNDVDKVTTNDAKWLPKWNQNGAKMASLRPRVDPERTTKTPKWSYQVAKWS